VKTAAHVQNWSGLRIPLQFSGIRRGVFNTFNNFFNMLCLPADYDCDLIKFSPNLQIIKKTRPAAVDRLREK